MIASHIKRITGLVAILMTAPVLAMAQDIAVLVIGNPAPSAPMAFADSFRVAERFRALGLNDVTLQRDIGPDTLDSTLGTLAGLSNVVVYFAGPIGQPPTGPALFSRAGGDARGGIDAILAQLAAEGTKQALILIEDCSGEPGQAGRLAVPVIPAGLDLTLVASAGPDGVCATGAARLTDAIDRLNDLSELSAATAPFWVGVQGGELPMPVAPAKPVAAPAFADIMIIDSGVMPVSAQLQPVDSVDVIMPASFSTTDAPVFDDATVIFVAPPASQLAAIPQLRGLPEPSIIVGIIASAAAGFDTVPDTQDEVSSNEISYDNLEARRGLRAENPELFASLVAGGAFDPPDTVLVSAIQTEMQRMKCYDAAIDGSWGNGSRASVDRYFAKTAGVAPVNREPTVELFRQIIQQDEVECPPLPVAVRVAPQVATGTRTTPRTTARAPAAAAPRTQPARQPAAVSAPAPTPAPSGGLNSGALGGVFR